MKQLSDVLLMCKEDKLEQIRLRSNLIQEMVGQLYPSILKHEIYQIKMSM